MGEFTKCGVQEMGRLRDREFRRWLVEEMGSSGDGGVHEMGIVADGEFRSTATRI